MIYVYDCTYVYNSLHVHIDTVLLWRSNLSYTQCVSNFPDPIPTVNASGTEASTRSVASSWLLCRLWPMILAGCHTGSVLDRWTCLGFTNCHVSSLDLNIHPVF